MLRLHGHEGSGARVRSLRKHDEVCFWSAPLPPLLEDHRVLGDYVVCLAVTKGTQQRHDEASFDRGFVLEMQAGCPVPDIIVDKQRASAGLKKVDSYPLPNATQSGRRPISSNGSGAVGTGTSALLRRSPGSSPSALGQDRPR